MFNILTIHLWKYRPFIPKLNRQALKMYMLLQQLHVDYGRPVMLCLYTCILVNVFK